MAERNQPGRRQREKLSRIPIVRWGYADSGFVPHPADLNIAGSHIFHEILQVGNLSDPSGSAVS